jgi:RNA polymerase sigma factor (sigma-70 family)
VRELPQSEADGMPEAEAIRLALQGNVAAFERLYRLHSRRVFTLCVRMLENSAEAEDLTQETFLTVFRRIHAFRGETSFSTWLHLVTVTVVLLHIHRKIVAETSREETTDRTEETQARGVELGDADRYFSANRFTFEAVPPGNHPLVRGNKIVPFRRKRDAAIGHLKSEIDSTADAGAVSR